MRLEADGRSGPLRAGLHREVAAVLPQVRVLRLLLTEWAGDLQIPGDLVEDMLLAVDEAMTNVVMHAYPVGTTGTLTLSVQHTDIGIVAEVRDTGRWREGPSRPGGGRGISLVRALAPDAVISSTLNGTTVRLAWPWTPPPG